MAINIKKPWQIDDEWALEMQQFAMPIYRQVWGNARIVELDKDRRNQLSRVLDVGGADKMIEFTDGGLAFLAQRFRRWQYRKYDDFTLRKNRPSGNLTEFEKGMLALQRHGFVAGFYSYGLANKTETGFERFRILRYPELLRAILTGELQPQILANTNGSSNFFAVPFISIPKDFFVLDKNRDDLQSRF
jgi:hypothetical protein